MQSAPDDDDNDDDDDDDGTMQANEGGNFRQPQSAAFVECIKQMATCHKSS